MIYLDANAFYWYYGRDKLNLPQSKPIIDIKKLRDYLDSCTNISLPASVWMEIIVHFRKNPNEIKNIISFMIPPPKPFTSRKKYVIIEYKKGA